MRYPILGLILMCLLIISPVSASSGFTAGPAQLAGSGSIMLHNTGDTPLLITPNVVQIMTKDNDPQLFDSKFPIQFSESGFILQPGEVKNIQITVPDTQGLLYGVKMIASNPADTGVSAQIAIVVKISSGLPVDIVKNLIVIPKISPIWLSGINIPLNYAVDNQGNVPMDCKLNNVSKTFYPGDNGMITSEQSIPWWYAGPFDISNDMGKSSVFIVPIWMFLIILVGSVIVILRRKVEINLK